MAEDAILLLVVTLIASSVFGILARRLGFSPLTGYILGGVIVGPILHLVDTQSPLLSFLSELGARARGGPNNNLPPIRLALRTRGSAESRGHVRDPLGFTAGQEVLVDTR